MSLRNNRPFSSGSRKAPDPYDQFLEREGFFRKHTARDASCLFRVVSEQLFDIQKYHLKVREDCIKYMRKHHVKYEKYVKGSFEQYLNDLSKFRTYGTKLELRAIADSYKVNVLVFEPYNLGNWLVRNAEYEKTLRVFFSMEKHFDTIFPEEYIATAAWCQALVYETLYKSVYQLPDVAYAVERMLHDPEGKEMIYETSQHDKKIVDRAISNDGQVFVFDSSDNSSCVLDDHKLCHFHNKKGFKSIVDSKKNNETIKTEDGKLVINSNYSYSNNNRSTDSLLYDDKISCVRQLLEQGITPFPYRVAKALDPTIYRNSEFDSWNEMRKEMRSKSSWFYEPSHFHVGVRCLVKLRGSGLNLYSCYIQDVEPDNGLCLVYVEELCEKHTVPICCLQPMPPKDIKPWLQLYKFNNRYSDKLLNEKKKNLVFKSKLRDIYTPEEQISKLHYLDEFTRMDEFQPEPVELITMPMAIDLNKKNDSQNNNNERNNEEKEQQFNSQVGPNTNFEPQPHPPPHAHQYPVVGANGVTYFLPNTMMGYGDPNHYANPYDPNVSAVPHPGTPHAGYYQSSQYVAYSVPTLPYNYASPPHQMYQHAPGALPPLPPMPVMPVNLMAPMSQVADGSDLPMNDIATLRFFYNLGVETNRNNARMIKDQFLSENPNELGAALQRMSMFSSSNNTSANSKTDSELYSKSTGSSFNTTTNSSSTNISSIANNSISTNNTSTASSCTKNTNPTNNNNNKNAKAGNNQAQKKEQQQSIPYQKRVTFESRSYHGRQYNKDAKNYNNNYNSNNNQNSNNNNVHKLTLPTNSSTVSYNSENPVNVATSTSTPYCISPIAPLDPSELNYQNYTPPHFSPQYPGFSYVPAENQEPTVSMMVQQPYNVYGNVPLQSHQAPPQAYGTPIHPPIEASSSGNSEYVGYDPAVPYGSYSPNYPQVVYGHPAPSTAPNYLWYTQGHPMLPVNQSPMAPPSSGHNAAQLQSHSTISFSTTGNISK